MFTHDKSTKGSKRDTHHLLRVGKEAKRMGVDPYIYYNQIIAEHYHHINLLHDNKSKNGYEAQKNLLGEILRKFKEEEPQIEANKYAMVIKLYKFCTIEMWDKNYYLDNYDEINEAYKILKELSDEKKGN